jgi:hypothetical protein
MIGVALGAGSGTSWYVPLSPGFGCAAGTVP